jgi:hypothetical protein
MTSDEWEQLVDHVRTIHDTHEWTWPEQVKRVVKHVCDGHYNKRRYKRGIPRRTAGQANEPAGDDARDRHNLGGAMTPKTCENCKHWLQRRGHSKIGDCCRYPPTGPGLKAAIPTTRSDDTCGEFDDKPATKEQKDPLEGVPDKILNMALVRAWELYPGTRGKGLDDPHMRGVVARVIDDSKSSFPSSGECTE